MVGNPSVSNTVSSYMISLQRRKVDYILPFAAVPENGRKFHGLDEKSELTHRIMLVNLLRLLKNMSCHDPE